MLLLFESAVDVSVALETIPALLVLVMTTAVVIKLSSLSGSDSDGSPI